MFLVCYFFFKQKTAYEMRISDWSSDVCSSDLEHRSRVLTDRGIEFETSTFQQAFEPSVCVCSSSGQSNPFAEGVHGGQRFEGAKVGPAAEEIASLGPRELAVYLLEPLGEQIGVRVALGDTVGI